MKLPKIKLFKKKDKPEKDKPKKKKKLTRNEELVKEFDEGRVLQVGNNKDNKKHFKELKKKNG